MNSQKKALSLAACLLIALVSSGALALQDQTESGAKALFYSPQSGDFIRSDERTDQRNKTPRSVPKRRKRVQPRPANPVGLRYWIELEGGGWVTAEHVFHTGDAIRLHLTSNVDGYVSLWTLDRSGIKRPLFPPPNQPQFDNYIKAGADFVTPNTIRFVPPAEDERLVVFFSRSARDLRTLTGNRVDNQIIAQAKEPAGAKALVFETENQNPTQIGTYVVNKNGGGITQEIRLKHR